ncbi:MAG: hypothetical protein KAU31_03790, partial [Spirochaetaceae bacterium]|nr:hypothetical protein [Spirochaetaceae bacterium]
MLLRLIVVALVVVVPFACRRPAATDTVEDTVTVVIGRDETEPGPEVVPEREPDPEPPKDEQVALAAAGQIFPDGKSWEPETDEADPDPIGRQSDLPDGKSSTAQTSFPDGKTWIPAEPVEP